MASTLRRPASLDTTAVRSGPFWAVWCQPGAPNFLLGCFEFKPEISQHKIATQTQLALRQRSHSVLITTATYLVGDKIVHGNNSIIDLVGGIGDGEFIGLSIFLGGIDVWQQESKPKTKASAYFFPLFWGIRLYPALRGYGGSRGFREDRRWT